MSDALERVLQLVAEGRLTAEEAAPLLDALEAAQAPPPSAPAAPGEPGFLPTTAPRPRSASRSPTQVARSSTCAFRLPWGVRRWVASQGCPRTPTQQIREAISAGVKGPVFDVVDEKGDGVRVVLE